MSKDKDWSKDDHPETPPPRKPNADFPAAPAYDVPPEWLNTAPTEPFLPPDILRVKKDSYFEPPGMELEHGWSSKDPAYLQTAYEDGFRPAIRNPNGPQIFARPNIDPAPGGTTIEKHDSLLMVAPKHVVERIRDRIRRESREKRQSAEQEFRAAVSTHGGKPLDLGGPTRR